MKEKPILFSASEVRAILEGRKTMTRRIMKSPTCPYGAPGQQLWVRESFSYDFDAHRDGYRINLPVWYWADGNPPHGDWTKPKPAIHMPRWASRITLEVTEVRAERLQDISDVDAVWVISFKRVNP